MAIFQDDEDRRRFVQALEEACGMTGWRVHAWVLLAVFVVDTDEKELLTPIEK